MTWISLILALVTQSPTLDLVVGNVTCLSCAVSIRAAMKQGKVPIVRETLTPPYARLTVKRDKGDLKKAFTLLKSAGYPVFVVVETETSPIPDSEFQTHIVGKDTLQVVSADQWIEMQRSSSKEVSP